MEFLAHVFFQAATHRFTLVAVAGIVLCLTFPGILASGMSVRSKVWLAAGVFVGFFSTIVYFIAGPDLATDLVYRYGEKATATITSSYPTGDVYNDRPVHGFEVLIRTAGNTVVQTSFAEDDFNVYPPSDMVDYPGINDVFTVRYLPDFPKDFVIVADDDSPWANTRRCESLQRELMAARAKYEFDRTSSTYQTAYVETIRSFVRQKCYADDNDRRAYDQDIEDVQNGSTPAVK